MGTKRLAFAEGPRNERLFHLLRRVREGDVLIPRFQRPFVWTDAQRMLLLDSIRRRLPIGALIVWRTMTQELQCFEQIAGVAIKADPASRRGEVKTYVLDGHQRLTTLYAALADGLATEEGSPAVELTQVPDEDQPGDDHPTQLLYDLESEIFVRSPAAGKPPSTTVPLSILFDRYRLREFEHDHLLGRGDGKRLINRLGELVDAFKDYELPMITLATEDKNLATEAFTRVNSAGTALDQVGMVTAAVWNDDVDLEARIDAVLTPLAGVGWQDLEAKMVLAAVKARLGLDIYASDVDKIRERIKSEPTVFDDTANDLQRAAELLASVGIHGSNTLPYGYQVVLLADALGLASDPREPHLLERLRRWFWSTTYSETFAGMSSTRLRIEQEHVRAIVTAGAEPMHSDAPVVPILRFDFRSARSRAMAIGMANDLKPRGPDGQELDATRLLAQYGNDATALLYLGKQADSLPTLFASASPATAVQRRAPENRIICPPTQANELRRMLTAGLDDCPREIRLSHGIDDDAVEAWHRGGASAMLRTRRARLLALEQARVERVGLSYAPDPAL